MNCHITLFLFLFFKRSTIFTVHINYLRFGCHWENNVLTLVKELLTDGQVQIFRLYTISLHNKLANLVTLYEFYDLFQLFHLYWYVPHNIHYALNTRFSLRNV